MKNINIYQILTLFSISFLLSSCGGKENIKPSTPIKESAPQVLPREAQSNVQLLNFYEKQANISERERKAYYQLLAAEVLIDENDTQAAIRKLSNLNTNQLDVQYKDRLRVLEARIASTQGRHTIALRILPKIKKSDVEHVKRRILETRALALNGAGYSVESIQAYNELIKHNPDSPYLHNYNTEIWKTLNNLSDIERHDIVTTSKDTVLRGWVQLVKNLEAGLLSGYDQEIIINTWKKRHITHPAYSFVDTIKNFHNITGVTVKAQNIALLLPLSNERYKKFAHAIKNGFLSAYYEDVKTSSEAINPPRVTVIDVSKLTNPIEEQLEKLQKSGVDLVVGPLAKDAVKEVLQTKLNMPVLTLNQVSEKISNPLAFQFGLIPEAEARQAAELAIARGEITAAILYPKSTFGSRMFSAFKQRYEELGGNIVSSTTYIETASDHKTAIQQLFNIHHSYNRQSILSSVLQHKPQFEARHRKDIEALFVIANSVQGRLLKPQLKFHNIVNIPVYATSRIYAGKLDNIRDRDLNGVIFTETPWLMLKEKHALFNTITKTWPKDVHRLARLYALGIDAYNIIPHLQRLQQNKTQYYKGASGNIYLDNKQLLQRELTWAQFKKGTVELLGLHSLDREQTMEKRKNVLPQ